jgi:hypothetical protein
VCNPREITSQDNKADKSDAKRPAELLRTHGLKAVYHGQHGIQALKEAFKSAATTGAMGVGRLHVDTMVANGTRPSLTLLTLARKIASIVLAVWKKGETCDNNKLKFVHAV